MKKLRGVVCALVALVLFLCFPTGAALADTEYVYVGGYPVGISIDVGGLLVESVTGIETDYGTAYVDGIQRGDIIVEINGKTVSSAEEVTEGLGDEVTVKLLRNGETVMLNVKPITEAFTGKRRLGVKIKDKLYGVGTVTFVRGDKRYAALGHEIYDNELNVHIPFAGGHVHACKLIGIKKGQKGEAGAILAALVPDKIYGTVTCNNNFGIAGLYDHDFDTTDKLPLGTRDDVTVGSAQIRTTVNGSPEYFDIEIIKATKQAGRKEKGIVFRVTDKRLLELTGGVVRGMSGSPIIQNGKLVAAVTHVFLNDFTKGYGVYADCLN
ncbi:MAG: PDZ domain-containing protein [Clostridiales bacterium]|nr:PDZ domain-containing protein [Clostridiales bacterium]